MHLYRVSRGLFIATFAVFVLLMAVLGALGALVETSVTRVIAGHEQLVTMPQFTAHTRLPESGRIPQDVSRWVTETASTAGVEAAVTTQADPAGGTDFLLLTVSVDPTTITARYLGEVMEELDTVPTVLRDAGLGDRGIVIDDELVPALNQVTIDVDRAREVARTPVVVVWLVSIAVVVGVCVVSAERARAWASTLRARGAAWHQMATVVAGVPAIASVVAGFLVVGGAWLFAPTPREWAVAAVGVLTATGVSCAVATTIVWVACGPQPPRTVVRQRQLVTVLVGVVITVLISAMWWVVTHPMGTGTVWAMAAIVLSCIVVGVGAVVGAARAAVRYPKVLRHPSPAMVVGTASVAHARAGMLALATSGAAIVAVVVWAAVIVDGARDAEEQAVEARFPAAVEWEAGGEVQALRSRELTDSDATRRDARAFTTHLTGQVGSTDAVLRAVPITTSAVVTNGELAQITRDLHAKIPSQLPAVGEDGRITMTLTADRWSSETIHYAGARLTVDTTVWLVHPDGDIRVVNASAPWRWDDQHGQAHIDAVDPSATNGYRVAGARVTVNTPPAHSDGTVITADLTNLSLNVNDQPLPPAWGHIPETVLLGDTFTIGATDPIPAAMSTRFATHMSLEIGDQVTVASAGSRVVVLLTEVFEQDRYSRDDVLVPTEAYVSAHVGSGGVPRHPTQGWARTADIAPTEVTVSVRAGATGVFPNTVFVLAAAVSAVMGMAGLWVVNAATAREWAKDERAAALIGLPRHVVLRARRVTWGWVAVVTIPLSALAGVGAAALMLPTFLAAMGW